MEIQGKNNYYESELYKKGKCQNDSTTTKNLIENTFSDKNNEC